jgi:hypothetical protein
LAGNEQRDIDQQNFFRPYYSITIPDKKSVKGKLSAIQTAQE